MNQLLDRWKNTFSDSRTAWAGAGGARGGGWREGAGPACARPMPPARRLRRHSAPGRGGSACAARLESLPVLRPNLVRAPTWVEDCPGVAPPYRRPARQGGRDRPRVAPSRLGPGPQMSSSPTSARAYVARPPRWQPPCPRPSRPARRIARRGVRRRPEAGAAVHRPPRPPPHTHLVPLAACSLARAGIGPQARLGRSECGSPRAASADRGRAAVPRRARRKGLRRREARDGWRVASMGRGPNRNREASPGRRASDTGRHRHGERRIGSRETAQTEPDTERGKSAVWTQREANRQCPNQSREAGQRRQGRCGPDPSAARAVRRRGRAGRQRPGRFPPPNTSGASETPCLKSHGSLRAPAVCVCARARMCQCVCVCMCVCV